jgi:two-component system response regulator HydG
MLQARRAKVLVVDDHVEMAKVLADQLRDEGYDVVVADSGQAAIARAREVRPELVITDLRMQEVDGLDVLDAVRAVDSLCPVVIMTAFGAVESAVEAMRRGAFHYLTKPFQLAEVLVVVERALDDRRLRDENRVLRRVAGEKSPTAALVGRSRVMSELGAIVERVALAQAPALLRGESGTGKEIVARALHYGGPRREAAFVAVNCTALPEQLLESELFGHVRGAFTGAASVRRGLLVEADGGTLFLDEIGDMAPALQARLLRVLQDGEVRAVGADAPRKVNVRIVAATHRDLESLIQDGTFRADLYYRLNVATIHVPALRERREDIPLLVEHFLDQARARNPHTRVQAFSPAAITALTAAPWPGNVRELENAVERMVIMSTSTVVDEAEVLGFVPSMQQDPPPLRLAKDRILPLRQLEDEYIAWVLGQVSGNKPRAAELLGIDVSTLYRRERGR